MTTPIAEDLRVMDQNDFMLFLEVMRTARDLQDLAPDKSTEFLKECLETAKTHVDAGGTDPDATIIPILTQARLALATATD